jgi:hypothetical protein
MLQRCGALPAPVVPVVALPGLAFIQAINSATPVAGRFGRPTIISGAKESSETGSRSLSTSYCTG